jgi:hypothetical protein
MKAGKVWKNWGIGFGVNLVLVLAIAARQWFFFGNSKF